MYSRMKAWFVRTYFSPEFDVDTKCRNSCVIATFVIWIALVGDLLYMFSAEGVTSRNAVLKCPSLILAFSLPFGLLRAHTEDFITDATLTYLLSCCVVSMNVGMLVNPPTRPQGEQALLLLIAITFMKLPRWREMDLALLPAFIIGKYNATFALHNYPALLIVTPNEGLVTDILSHIRMVMFVPVVLALVRTQCRAYEYSVKSLQEAVSMTKTVSEHLAVYNIKHAELALQEYSCVRGYDHGLHSNLANIVQNMKKYKPFLPNYVIPIDAVSISPSFDDEDPEDVIVPDEVVTIPSSSSSPPHRSLPPTLPSSQPLITLPSSPVLETIPNLRNVSYALIDFALCSDDVIENPRPLKAFIDGVHHYANITRGALHTCIGDTIHVTWNAVRLVASPEMCAVGMIESCSRKRPAISSRVEVCGSVMSGPAECRMTGTIHQTFLLQIDWREAQTLLHQYARRVKTNVMCQNTRTVVPVPNILVDKFPGPVEVYEVLFDDLSFPSVGGPSMKSVVQCTSLVIELCSRSEYKHALEVLQSAFTQHSSLSKRKSFLWLKDKVNFLQKHNLTFESNVC